MMPETLIYGLQGGTTERWQEVLLCAPKRLLTEGEIATVQAAATLDGYHSFRVTQWDGSAPDFRSVTA